MEKQSLYTGKGVGVAILDTGIFSHVDFDDRITAFADFISYKNRIYDDNGHGTHVAGILAGSGRGCQGRYTGIAPGCSIIAGKVLDQYGNGKKEIILQAFRWILKNYKQYGIRIVNISVGTTCNTAKEHRTLLEGVDRLWDEGLVVVAAAGNQGPRPGSVTAPGSSRKVITVGSSDMMMNVRDASGRGPTGECVCKPDVVAPGFNIMSCAPYYSGTPSYVRKSGTSMSTPYVSGAIALMLEKDPRLTNVEIKMLVRECARDLGYPRNMQGTGEFNLKKFMTL